MRILLILTRGNKGRVIGIGKLLDMMLMATLLCNAVGCKLQKEKGMGEEQAMDFLLKSIKKYYKALR